ncbi:MAG: Zn-dependent exopeptidase M28 [Ruminococcaceae bacterium]|nr:Zn-dependent exopeptidase M28 [Oscillospiraceae bacterium]
MKKELIEKIFADTAFVHTGGSAEELKVAEYLRDTAVELGLDAHLEEFEVDMATVHEATLTVDGREIPCKGYLCAGNGDIEAPLYYLTEGDKYSLSLCKDKIVLIDGYLGYWRYKDMLDNGALAFVTYDGNVYFADRDIDHRELRSYFPDDRKIPGVNINAKDAVAIINGDGDGKMAKLTLKQDEYKGKSHNVVIDMPGETEKQIIFTAHYDTTSLSQGAYDNMSGSIGILSMAEYFSKNPHRYSLKFVFCGSEERGLLGSKAYCAAHEEELKNVDLVINLDMIGCIMGKFIACATAEKDLASYISYMGNELGFQVKAYQDVYSSDSTPFADKGVPAVSFARMAGGNLHPIHNSYDTLAVMKTEHMQKDIDFITAFASRMANAVFCPVSREIPDNIKERLDEYLLRKRKKA